MNNSNANNCTFIQKNTTASILSVHPNYNIDNLGHYTNAYDYHTPTQNILIHLN
jgi:hypothetical protein